MPPESVIAFGGVFCIIDYCYKPIEYTYSKNPIKVKVLSKPFSNFETEIDKPFKI